VRPSTSNRRIIAVDVFCGAGGLTRGLKDAGIHVEAGIDSDAACEQAYTRNNPDAKFVHADVAALTAEQVSAHFLNRSTAPRLLAGCAPCQPFSTYRQKSTLEPDSRWHLLEHFGRLVDTIQPELVTIENVPSLTKADVFRDFLKLLRDHNYAVWFDTIDCANFGVPQIRRRLVLLATLLSTKAPTLAARARKTRLTVRGALGNLQALAAGESSVKDRLHRSAGLSKINLERIRISKPGGTWRDWPELLRVPCHKRASGDGYTAVYGRMVWTSLSPTVTTQCHNYGSGRFGHPSQDRAISLREAALLQGFPRNYSFDSEEWPLTMTQISRMIGNAIPPPLARAIGETLTQHVMTASRAARPPAKRR